MTIPVRADLALRPVNLHDDGSEFAKRLELTTPMFPTWSIEQMSAIIPARVGLRQ